MKNSKETIIDFLKKAAFIADKSSCNYKIGCVGVIEDNGLKLSSEVLQDPYVRKKNGYIYIKSWNVTLPGELYCQRYDNNGRRICVREVENLKGQDYQKVCTSHAEIGLMAKCAKYGIRTSGMSLFITNSPCYVCAKALIQAGIRNVYYMAKHTDESGLKILKVNKVRIELVTASQIFTD